MIQHLSLRPEAEAEMLAVHGELDASAAPDLGARIDQVLESPKVALVIDLTKCAYLGSPGIRTLVAGAKELRLRDGRMVLIANDSQPRRVAERTGIDRLMAICRSRDEALRLLASGLGD